MDAGPTDTIVTRAVAPLPPKSTASAFTGPARSGPASADRALRFDWEDLPAVTRKTSRGVPRYPDAVGRSGARPDVFVLSGEEELVPLAASHPGRLQYGARSDGLFARVEHVRDGSGDFWEVEGRDGLVSRYGTPRPAGVAATWRDPAVVADPRDPRRVFGWQITQIQDPLGNLVTYEYLRDRGYVDGHVWDQPRIARISHGDYGDRANPAFVLTMEFGYELRPDPSVDRRAGFEVRTTLRCRTIRVVTQTPDGVARTARAYELGYGEIGLDGRSRLSRVRPLPIDQAGAEPTDEAHDERRSTSKLVAGGR